MLADSIFNIQDSFRPAVDCQVWIQGDEGLNSFHVEEALSILTHIFTPAPANDSVDCDYGYTNEIMTVTPATVTLSQVNLSSMTASNLLIACSLWIPSS